MDEKTTVSGRSSSTLWNCRRIMTDKWLKLGEDTYNAPYPKEQLTYDACKIF